MDIKTCWLNILETSSVVLTAGSEDAGYPLYRLYDRNIGRMFKPASASTVEIRIDQGASPLSVDRLLIPAGHNLNGMTLDIKHSDDDVVYSPAVAQWTGASGVIDKSWASISKRYWKFIITNPASVPEISEVFLTSTYQWERGPARPGGPFDPEFNVTHQATTGGQDRFLVHGPQKRRRRYRVLRASDSQKNNIIALNDSWQGARPFWMCDHEGAWIYGRLNGPINVKEESHGRYSYEFDFIEVLP